MISVDLLIRCFNRLHEPTSGAIYIDGDNIVSYDQDELKKNTTRKNRDGISAFWSF